MEWWGLGSNEKWHALFLMTEVEETDGMEHYPECRWIVKGRRFVDPLAMNEPETVWHGL